MEIKRDVYLQQLIERKDNGIKNCLMMRWRDTMSGKERIGKLQIIMKKSNRVNRRSCSMK